MFGYRLFNRVVAGSSPVVLRDVAQLAEHQNADRHNTLASPLNTMLTSVGRTKRRKT